MAPGDPHLPERVLVVARHPFRVSDLGLGTRAEGRVRLIRRPSELGVELADARPDLVLVDIGLPGGSGLRVIDEVLAVAPDAAVLALTPDPPEHDEVARAVRAGAVGFIDVDAQEREFAEAIATVGAGGTWFPPEELRPVLSSVADDLDTASAQRRSRLTGILLGLIPLTGLLAALMAFLWRKYLAQIGVRPVDLAVDPASRVVDAVVGMSLVLGAFGPLLLVGTWLDLLRGSRWDRGPLAWLLERRRTAHLLASLVWLGVAWVVTRGPDLLLVVVVGPAVAIAVVAQALGLSDELPALLRIEIRPVRVLVGGCAALVVFLGLLSGEALLVGPDLRDRGADGILVPRVLGFRAQPVQAFDITTGDGPRELLYLGGNADLYVLVDVCNDNTIEMVSVSTQRLVVIDEVTCDDPGE